MAAKRKAEALIPAEESDQLLIRPLGAGQEVGRSCIILEFKGRKIMLDCGIHPGLEGMDALPYIDLIDPAEIDLLLISHNISADDMLYTETDLEESMDKIETINFHEVKEVAGIKFWCYHAGHVLGAAMFMIEIAGVKESTYGTHIHEKREEREARFCNTVHDIVNRGGRGLIPVFALGRAQELLLILDEYWQNHPELHDIPIYYASSLAKKCMAVYQTYVNAMNDKIRKQININNPFVFKHISNLKSMDHFDDIGPSVVMASPGMMQSGLSRELFESWCTDKRNGVIIAGYCVEGTLAKHIMSEPEEITTMSGQKLPLKMSVDYISFSAHTDYQQTSEFIRALKPPHVILVHGEQNEMARLKAALIREYEDNDEVHIEVHNPRNTEAVTLNFRGEKLAKVMGSLADKKPEQGQRISGILVKRNFNYHILSPCDLSNYTDLAMSTVTQTQAIPYTGPFNLLSYQLQKLTGDVEEIEIQQKPALKVFKNITVIQEPGMVVLEWVANPANDMYADTVTTVILEVQSNPKIQKAAVSKISKKIDMDVYRKRMEIMLQDMFGEDCVSSKDDSVLCITVDGKTANISLDTRYSFQENGWGSYLAERLVRKCDVLNRGISGYNTRWAKLILPRLIPESTGADSIVAVTIFFGANDSALKELNPKQHVPLEEYAANLKSMVQYLKSVDITADRIILITPPPLQESAWEKACLAKGEKLNRCNATTGQYAQACVQVARECSTDVLDLWTLMQKNQDFSSYLSDGLHLSPKGNSFLAAQLWSRLENKLSALPSLLPYWRDVDHTNPEASLL
ncbi:Cleavage and polyadenylation specificity factor subunit 3 [Turdus rufiventris]|nr:Cleavage and polyadenylation specificity factor subunit 3 [Turdus rufiventris]